VQTKDFVTAQCGIHCIITTNADPRICASASESTMKIKYYPNRMDLQLLPECIYTRPARKEEVTQDVSQTKIFTQETQFSDLNNLRSMFYNSLRFTASATHWPSTYMLFWNTALILQIHPEFQEEFLSEKSLILGTLISGT
jgi:hypothetical protein